MAWTFDRRNELSKFYNRLDPDIILLNATGLNNVKIFNYNIYQRNHRTERHAGIALAVRKDVTHRLIDDYNDDMLAIKLETSRGPILVATLYVPPRRQYLPTADIRRVTQLNYPTYITGDLNAAHQAFE